MSDEHDRWAELRRMRCRVDLLMLNNDLDEFKRSLEEMSGRLTMLSEPSKRLRGRAQHRQGVKFVERNMDSWGWEWSSRARWMELGFDADDLLQGQGGLIMGDRVRRLLEEDPTLTSCIPPPSDRSPSFEPVTLDTVPAGSGTMEGSPNQCRILTVLCQKVNSSRNLDARGLLARSRRIAASVNKLGSSSESGFRLHAFAAQPCIRSNLS